VSQVISFLEFLEARFPRLIAVRSRWRIASGYTPILELGLLAGIHLLFRRDRILEIKDADNVLAEWQRQSPDSVRFTVDRMGNRAFVKFIRQRTLPSSVGS
jgi:hypothetical protein